jgi:hypothetical protein
LLQKTSAAGYSRSQIDREGKGRPEPARLPPRSSPRLLAGPRTLSLVRVAGGDRENSGRLLLAPQAAAPGWLVNGSHDGGRRRRLWKMYHHSHRIVPRRLEDRKVRRFGGGRGLLRAVRPPDSRSGTGRACRFAKVALSLFVDARATVRVAAKGRGGSLRPLFSVRIPIFGCGRETSKPACCAPSLDCERLSAEKGPGRGSRVPAEPREACRRPRRRPPSDRLSFVEEDNSRVSCVRARRCLGVCAVRTPASRIPAGTRGACVDRSHAEYFPTSMKDHQERGDDRGHLSTGGFRRQLEASSKMSDTNRERDRLSEALEGGSSES